MSSVDAVARAPDPSLATADATTYPWRRWLARMFDSFVFSNVVMVLVILLGMLLAPAATEKVLEVLEGPAAAMLSNMLGVLIAWPIIALLLPLTGTPGKWLCGIRVVRRADGERPTLRESLVRECLVWVRGLGLGFPVVSWVMQLLSHGDLRDFGETTWDRRLGLQVLHAPPSVFGLVKRAFALLVVFTAYGLGVGAFFNF